MIKALDKILYANANMKKQLSYGALDYDLYRSFPKIIIFTLRSN